MNRGTSVALDDKMWNPVAGKQNGCGEADQAAAHHKDGTVTFGHACSISDRAAPRPAVGAGRAPADTGLHGDTYPFCGQLVED